MALLSTTRLLVASLLIFPTFIFAQKFGFNQVLEDAPDEPTVFCIPNHQGNVSLMEQEGIHIKFETKNWLFITSTPRWIDAHKKDGSLDDYYFEYAPPAALSDTARMHHNVDDVQAGSTPLNVSYTGKDVIIGVVDQGLDWTHPDFIDANGDTRVLRYWDHTASGNPPTGFGYGYEWDSTSINNGTCTSTESGTAHGTTVAGQALGNGNANGTNIGMAPDANIVIVESNFAASNWTLTIADAVQYIFDIADEYNMPAVVNLSLGSYLGSHDGNDPASEAMETLLDEKPGRLVVVAAGNSGAKGPYHQGHTVTSDTNFVWFKNNPTATIAPNTIFFDLWSDQADGVFDFAIGADDPSNYSFRGRTNFHNAATLGTSPVHDTIWNNGNRIATVQIYHETVYGDFHMQVYLADVDSTSYMYRFETTGSGHYDLWSGKWLGYNDMESSNIPTTAQMPDIANYVLPDTLQTIVSAWNCSEKIVSVANMRNRWTFLDKDSNYFVTSSQLPVGTLSLNSSKGPSRHGVMKPDITAAGDMSLSAGPLWLLGNSAYNSIIDSGGWHVLNGGTSMASPVIAGIGALYFERCGMATYQNFLDDLHATAYTDQFTGTVPNYAFGYGKADAMALLMEETLETQPTISYVSGNLSSSTGTSYQWYIDGAPVSGQTNQTIGYEGDGSYQVMTINTDGCYALSDPYEVTAALQAIGIKRFNVYPNPSSDLIEVVTSEDILSVQCFDLNGKTIDVQLENNTINVSNMTSGTYVLHFTTVSGQASARFVKM